MHVTVLKIRQYIIREGFVVVIREKEVVWS